MKKKHYFTQTELIVCSVAVLLLGSVIFSAVCTAQGPSAASKSVLCQANMKKLGTQFMLYADDYKVLPYVNKNVSKDLSWNFWNGLLYHGGYLKADKPHRLGAVAGNSELMRCPAETETKYSYNYGVNIWLAYISGVKRSKNNQLAMEASLRLQDIPNAGKRILFTDAQSFGTAADIGNVFRHEGETFNAYFLDGHVSCFAKPLDMKSHDNRVMFSKILQ